MTVFFQPKNYCWAITFSAVWILQISHWIQWLVTTCFDAKPIKLLKILEWLFSRNIYKEGTVRKCGCLQLCWSRLFLTVYDQKLKPARFFVNLFLPCTFFSECCWGHISLTTYILHYDRNFIAIQHVLTMKTETLANHTIVRLLSRHPRFGGNS